MTPLKSGSSPLARGLRVMLTTGTPTTRIIPARAGFTHRPASAGGTRKDHPRSRGVYALKGMMTDDAVGSSPLARGLRRWSRTQINRSGIIPARAGFTDWERPIVGDAPGSSPLARGLQIKTIPDGAMRGIIPARAGFTHGYLEI